MRKVIQEALLRTITLYDALDIALTPFEIWRFLVRPVHRRNQHPPSLGSVFQTLAQLKKKGMLEVEWGVYVLAGKRELCEERIRSKKIADQKWKLAKRGALLLSFVPFVRLVASNGSLAKRATSPDADLDVLIVVEHGRIWTARFLATLLLQLLGWRRHGKHIRDRICLNHYLTTKSLTIRDELVSTPHMMAWMEPILDNSEFQNQKSEVLFERFMKANDWVGAYLWNWEESKTLWQRTLHQVIPSRAHGLIRGSLEWFLSGKLGERLERFARWLQLRYMERSLSRLSPEERACIKISDSSLEFHPGLSHFYHKFKKRFEMGLARLKLSMLE